jgi:hypothetical protein
LPLTGPNGAGRVLPFALSRGTQETFFRNTMDMRANASALSIPCLWNRRVLLNRILMAACMLLWAFPAAGQQRSLEPGAQVRITAPEISSVRLHARFQSSRADTLYIASGTGLPTAIPLHMVHRLEARQPRSRAQGAWRGAGYGFVIPLAIGLIANMAEEGAGAGPGMVAFTLGPVLGAIWGARNPGERWERIEPTAP